MKWKGLGFLVFLVVAMTALGSAVAWEDFDSSGQSADGRQSLEVDLPMANMEGGQCDIEHVDKVQTGTGGIWNLPTYSCPEGSQRVVTSASGDSTTDKHGTRYSGEVNTNTVCIVVECP